MNNILVQEKVRIITAAIIFMRSKAEFSWMGYKINEDTYTKLITEYHTGQHFET
jgi:hypothetical protein